MSKEKYGIIDAHYLCDSAIFNTETDEIFRLYQVCDILNQQDQRIVDLEAKLAESEIRSKESEIFYKREINRRDTKLRNIKQQLAMKEKEVQKWKDGTTIVKLCDLEQQLAEKDKELLEIKQRIAEKASKEFQEMIEKRENHNQNKISFAVDKLKKLKDRLSSMQWCFTGQRNFLQEVEFMRKSQEEMIDEEIEDLLKGVK